MEEVTAKGRFIRISPQKVRMLVGAVKGRPVEDALNSLKFMPQKAAGIVEKIMRSAVANADQKADIDVDSLIVKNLLVDQGPSYKRWRARARGRVGKIIKRTSHITVVLADTPV